MKVAIDLVNKKVTVRVLTTLTFEDQIGLFEPHFKQYVRQGKSRAAAADELLKWWAFPGASQHHWVCFGNRCCCLLASLNPPNPLPPSSSPVITL